MRTHFKAYMPLHAVQAYFIVYPFAYPSCHLTLTRGCCFRLLGQVLKGRAHHQFVVKCEGGQFQHREPLRVCCVILQAGRVLQS